MNGCLKPWIWPNGWVNLENGRIILNIGPTRIKHGLNRPIMADIWQVSFRQGGGLSDNFGARRAYRGSLFGPRVEQLVVCSKRTQKARHLHECKQMRRALVKDAKLPFSVVAQGTDLGVRIGPEAEFTFWAKARLKLLARISHLRATAGPLRRRNHRKKAR